MFDGAKMRIFAIISKFYGCYFAVSALFLSIWAFDNKKAQQIVNIAELLMFVYWDISFYFLITFLV